MALSWYAPLPHNSPHIYLLNILTTETHVLSSLLRLSVVAILVLSNIVQINSETLENTIKMSSRFKKIWKLRFVDFFQIHNHSCLYLGSIVHSAISQHNKVQRGDLTCDVIRNSLRLCFGKIWILVADWSMPEPALVTWHVSYKITILPHHPNCNPLLNIWAFFDMNFSNPLKKVKVKIF